MTPVALRHLERPAAGEAVGALVFFHGYFGIPEDFLAFVDKIDPDRRFHGYLPEAPLHVRDGRWSWFDWEAPEEQITLVADWLDSLGVVPAWTVLGGWSQGGVMAYALALAPGRPPPSGLLALGAQLPIGPPLRLEPPFPAIAIGHGTADDAVAIDHARSARDALRAAGADVLYLETRIGHQIDQEIVPDLRSFLAQLP